MGNLVNCCIGEDEEGKRYFGRYEVNQAPDEGRYGYYHHHHLSCLKQDPPHKFSHSMIIRARAPLYTVSALLTNAPADAGAAAPITAAPSRTALSGVDEAVLASNVSPLASTTTTSSKSTKDPSFDAIAAEAEKKAAAVKAKADADAAAKKAKAKADADAAAAAAKAKADADADADAAAAAAVLGGVSKRGAAAGRVVRPIPGVRDAGVLPATARESV